MLVVAVPLLLSGCAAVALPAAMAVFSGGAKEAFHAGTEYAKGGVLYRTFSLSLPELRLALGDTLARMEVEVVEDGVYKDLRKIEARAHDRRIDIRLEPVTRTVTRLRVVISDGVFSTDRTTASEIMTQLERTIETREAEVASVLSDRIRSGRRTAESSPGPAARR